ncbi:hypothetical protein Tco_1347055 [Tanacetum coccineum]
MVLTTGLKLRRAQMLHPQAKSVFTLHSILIMYFLHKHRPHLLDFDLSEDENTEDENTEDENTEVVFAAKPDQLKIAEETANKRQRDDTVGEKKLTFADTVGERRGRTGEKKKLTFADTVEERGGRSVVKKLKFADMERKKERERGWGWRSAAISKPTKEKNSAIQQDNKLQQEPDFSISIIVLLLAVDLYTSTSFIARPDGRASFMKKNAEE